MVGETTRRHTTGARARERIRASRPLAPAEGRDISFLAQTRGLSREDAYSLASIAVDFEVSQFVDINEGVHAVVPKVLFPEGRA